MSNDTDFDQPTWTKKRIAIAAGVGLFLLFAALGHADEDTAGGSSDREYAAFDVCTEFVKDQLKAPGTAEFRNPYEDDGEVTITGAGDGPYTVRSTVDAQNGFGAQLRNSFSCTVSYTGDSNWHLEAPVQLY